MNVSHLATSPFKGPDGGGIYFVHVSTIFDQSFDWAEFQELVSAPPSMEAARVGDALSLFPGYVQKQSDATRASTQAFLKGTETWVSLPRERWPKSCAPRACPVQASGRRGVLGANL